MARVSRKEGTSNVARRVDAQKETKQVKAATITVNGFAYDSQKLQGYNTHASYVRRQQQAYKTLAEIKANELSSVSNILKKLAAK